MSSRTISIQPTASPPPVTIHWSMRAMSMLSLLALAIYTYVWRICRRAKSDPLSAQQERRRQRLSWLAFGLDLGVSAYFGAITPVLLQKGGLTLDRKQMPRPLFWFFAITGLLPTLSMTLTVVGGHKWRDRIKSRPAWRAFHGLTATTAYFSWWLACAPIFLMTLLGEKRAMRLAQKVGLLRAN